MDRDQERGTHPRPKLRSSWADHWWAAIPVLLIGVALFVVIRADGARPAPPMAGDGLEHVHGIGVDPAKGTVYAATHTGLFRVTGDETAERVADRYQDTMGFTVLGPNHFLASGHPALDDEKLRAPGKPPLLGLVESRDSGETWDSASLLGEADFHVVVAAHGRVFGYDSTGGRLRVSSDRKTWESRSPMPIMSLAVHPQRPDELVAVAEEGLVWSIDGGRGWIPATAPPLALLGWDGSLGLWALGPSGEVYRRSGDQPDWQKRGALSGPPDAFFVGDRSLYAAVRDGEGVTDILRSADGRTWELLYRGA